MFPSRGLRPSDSLEALNDPLLGPLLRADDAQFAAEVERLLTAHVRPLLGRILARYRGPAALTEQDAEDVSATIDLRVFEKLRRVRESAGQAVQDFAAYVSMMAYNVINDQLRLRHPARMRLKTRTRYVLTHDPRLALRTSSAGPVCSLDEWPATEIAGGTVVLDAARITRVMRDRERPADAITAILRAVGKPIFLDPLVTFLAELWQITDAPPVDLARLDRGEPDAAPDVLESRQYIEVLWREIRELRPMQRQALLLNLRDDQRLDVLSLLIVTGTAKFEQLAEAVEMPAGELTALWNDLPLDDARIAARLGITRQQVINLRKSARERLVRRMRR